MARDRRSADGEARGGRRIAVTGATGFYGRGLLQRLAFDRRVERVLALDVRQPPLESDKLVFRQLDLTHPTADQDLLEALRSSGVDTLVHLAFLAEPTHQSSWGHELEAIGTLHVLNACAEHGVRKVVMQSSTAVYGPNAKNPNFLRESHPLGGIPGSRYVADRVEAERQLIRFKREHPEVVCTSLRFAPVVGPTVRNWVTGYLSFPTPITILGYDPLIQLLHETDAIDALALAVERDLDGAWNIVADGVVPLAAALRLCGRLPVPMPGPAARAWVSTLWMMQLLSTPPTFLSFLRYLCVADGERARREMGFVPRYGTREALLSFAGARRLRETQPGSAA